MKKLSFLVAAAFVVLMGSCSGNHEEAKSEQLDSLSYAFGVAQSQGLKEYLVSMKVDTTNLDQFIKGLKEGMKDLSKEDEARQIGVTIGQQLKNQMVKGINQELFGTDSTKTISVDKFMAGFIAATTGKDCKMSTQSAGLYVRANMERIKASMMEKTYGANREAGEKFLAANAKKPGIKVTPSGLQYRIIKEGTGEKPSPTSRCKVSYKGPLIDGKVFDQTPAKAPITFAANQVIKGWTEALCMMPVGSKWQLFVPQQLAYGAREAGIIRPFSTLIFEVELLGIENGPSNVTPADQMMQQQQPQQVQMQ